MSNEALTRATLLRRGAGFVGAMTVGPGALEALLAQPALARAAAPSGTLTAAIAGDPKTMDPHRTTLAVFHNTIRVTVFDALVKIDDQNYEFVPSLAQSWTITPKAVTFKLRKGVKFHDGTPVRRERRRVQHQADQGPEDREPLRAEGRDREERRGHGRAHRRLQPLAPTPPILANLLQVQMISAASARLDKKPIGTGPFKFEEWKPGDHITVVKNPDYFKSGQPLLDTLVFKNVPDAQFRLTQLQTSAVQMIDGLDPKDVKTVPASDRRSLPEQAGSTTRSSRSTRSARRSTTSACGRRSRRPSTARRT